MKKGIVLIVMLVLALPGVTLHAVEPVEQSVTSFEVMKYDYHPDQVYDAFLVPGEVLRIELQAGEQIQDISLEQENDNWTVIQAKGRNGGVVQPHILVRSGLPDTQASLEIVTNKRTYHLTLQCSKESWMETVSWNYSLSFKPGYYSVAM